jgi:hypothetical protein
MKVSDILSQIDLGSIALPEFQRGYVWNRDQVRSLMQSLYRRYPVGSLLVWTTRSEGAHARGDGAVAPGVVKLLLDGQQRMTSLYGIIRGGPPKFFDGNAQTFTGLHFHLGREEFAFYSPLKMHDDPLWVEVAALMQEGVASFFDRFMNLEDRQTAKVYMNRLAALEGIQDIDLHIEEVTGADKTVDLVVDIFNRVNSGGTKLSKGDLALAKICAEWPDAREEMKKRLEKWRRAGFYFKLELLLRCITTILTGQAFFSSLADIDTARFQDGLRRAERAVDQLLNLIGARLGLDHDRVLGSRYSFPLMARYLDRRGFRLDDPRERDKLLHWYVHTFLWGRYAGSTETFLNQDLALISEPDGALDRLTADLRRHRGDLRLQANDFLGWSKGARFYPLLYLMTRVGKARDWASDLELSMNLLGRLNRLEVHHVFPKDLLYKHGYSRPDVNAIANFTFLTQETNLRVSNRDPAKYLEEFSAKHPEAVSSHWIPMDRRLWRVENYQEFLAERRALLAHAANSFLDSLRVGGMPEPVESTPILDRQVASMPGGIAGEEEEDLLLACNQWVIDQGLPEGELLFELPDPVTGEPLAVFDLAWPDGLQEGLSEPVALLIDEPAETHQAANRAGFRFFTDFETLRGYVQREILASEDVERPAA